MSSEDETSRLLADVLVVGTRPAYFWSWELRQLQTEFLEGIDPSYFSYQAEIHESELSGPNAQRAAVSIRSCYSHALETLFAVLGACIQAPYIPAAWMLHYKEKELVDFVTAIDNGAPILNRLGLSHVTWRLAASSTCPLDKDAPGVSEHIEATERLLRILGRDFLDHGFQQEYNAIKHGLRVNPAGEYSAMGIQSTPGKPAPIENMHVVSSHEFGATTLRSEYLNNKYQYALYRTRRNWSPLNTILRIQLAERCTTNLLAFLKMRNGFDLTTLRIMPISIQAIDDAGEDKPSTPGASFNRMIDAESFRPGLNEDVLRRFDGSEAIETD